MKKLIKLLILTLLILNFGCVYKPHFQSIWEGDVFNSPSSLDYSTGGIVVLSTKF